MIEDVQQLSASLRYMASWADLLEGLRRHAQTTDTALLPTTSAGPLDELRRVLAEAREYVDALADASPSAPPKNGTNGSAAEHDEPKRRPAPVA